MLVELKRLRFPLQRKEVVILVKYGMHINVPNGS